jgi:hypothetical protein
LLVFGALPASALTATDHLLLSGPDREVLPSATDTWLAWSENSRSEPRHFSVYVRRRGGDVRRRLNPAGTRAYSGGFDGDRFIFQQVSGSNQSDLRIYDLAQHRYLPVPHGVDTAKWEWAPSLSGDYLLFTRNTFRRRTYTARVILHRASTGHERILGTFRGRYQDGVAEAGQVSGDYAVWIGCPTNQDCDVFRYTISTGTTTKMPDHKQEYAPSVAADGTVFFMRSGPPCGAHAKLMRYASGVGETVRSFARNRDAFDTYAVSSTDVVHEIANCRTNDIDVNEVTIT